MSDPRGLIDPLADLLETGRPVALVTVTGVDGSAPCGPGIAMAVSEDRVVGSLPAGCVEGAVLDSAYAVVQDGGSVRTSYGCDADAQSPFAPTMTCGGTIEVLVHRLSEADAAALELLRQAVAADAAAVLATTLEGPSDVGSMVTVTADEVRGGWVTAIDAVRQLLGRSGVRRSHLPRPIENQVLLQAIGPRPRLLLFGGNDVAAATSRQAKTLGYRVTVCDARPAFATPQRFPAADEVVACWPPRLLETTGLTADDAVCVLTHDPKFDLPLVQLGLRSGAGYVGAMGSRRTHADRVAALRAEGLTESELARLRSPIGLDLGSETPAETAVAILAEIVQIRRVASARPLSRTTGRIHGPAAPSAVPVRP